MSDIEEIKKIVDIYIENKSSLSQYYSLCIGVFPELAPQFSVLSEGKKDQAELFIKIKTSVEQSPQKWAMGSFDFRILQFISDQIKTNLEYMLSESPNSWKIQSFINDIENSLAETEFYRALKTDIPEFEKLFAKMREDTTAHRKVLADVLQKI
jgi:hemoglobin-like flavoprotein